MENITSRILEELREKKGWSKTEVAKRLGIKTVSTYANWEYGLRTPDKEMIVKIAELYEVTTDYLLGRSSEPKLSADEDKKVTEETLRYLKILESLPDDERKAFEEKINEYAEYMRDKMK